MSMNVRDLYQKPAKYVDILIAFGILGIITLIILPVPTGALDLLLTLNITLSIIVLLISMFTTEVLDFSVFPSLLLVTTLFRLGLNISATRLILSEGYAGKVIESFGVFVTGENYIVGAIIYIIIVIIQLVVITSGASRVSEVSARFTLDAMPGKQMSIDADLNTGVINEQEAKEEERNCSRKPISTAPWTVP